MAQIPGASSEATSSTTSSRWRLCPGQAGALIGGTDGDIASVVRDKVEVAHPADTYDPVNAALYEEPKVMAVAVLAGTRPGETEAWAVEQGNIRFSRENIAYNGDSAIRLPAAQALLHYASDPTETLLSLDSRARPLPDAHPSPGDLSFAAFGKQDCQYPGSSAIR